MKKHAQIYVPLPGCDVTLDKFVQNFMIEVENRAETKKSAEDYIKTIKCDKVNYTPIIMFPNNFVIDSILCCFRNKMK